MNIPIIAGSASLLAAAILAMGYKDFQSVPWHRSPCRIDGVWHAEIRHA
jgi:alpha-N-acetylglucosamine transferase